MVVGQWKDGNHVGRGKFYWSNGDVYDGEWVRFDVFQKLDHCEFLPSSFPYI